MADHGMDLSSLISAVLNAAGIADKAIEETKSHAEQAADDVANHIEAKARTTGKKVGETLGNGIVSGVSEQKDEILDAIIDVKAAKKRIRELQINMINAAKSIKKLQGKGSLNSSDYRARASYETLLRVSQQEIEKITDELRAQGVVVRNTNKEYKELQDILEEIGFITRKAKKQQADVGKVTEDLNKAAKKATSTVIQGAEKVASAVEQQGNAIDDVTKKIENQVKATKQLVASQEKLQKAYLNSRKVYEVSYSNTEQKQIFPTLGKAKSSVKNYIGLGGTAEIVEKYLGDVEESLRESFEKTYYQPSAVYKPGKTFTLSDDDLNTYIVMIEGLEDFKSQFNRLDKLRASGVTSAKIRPNQNMLTILYSILNESEEVYEAEIELLERILAQRLSDEDRLNKLLEYGRLSIKRTFPGSDPNSTWANMARLYDGQVQQATQQQEQLADTTEAGAQMMAEGAKKAITSMSQLDDVIQSVYDKYEKLNGKKPGPIFVADIERAKKALLELNDIDVLSNFNNSIDKVVESSSLRKILLIPKGIKEGFSNISDFGEIIADQFRIAIKPIEQVNTRVLALAKALKRISKKEAGDDVAYYTQTRRLIPLLTKKEKEAIGVTDRNISAEKYSNDDVIRPMLNGLSHGTDAPVSTAFTLDLDSVTIYIKQISNLVSELTRLEKAYPAAKEQQDKFFAALRAQGAINDRYGALSPTLEQLQAVVAQFPEAQQFIDEIQSRIQKPVEQQEEVTAVVQETIQARKEEAEVTQNNIENMKQLQSLIGDLKSKYGEQSFNNIFGETIGQFGELNASNAIGLYDALMAKNEEYQKSVEEQKQKMQLSAKELQAFIAQNQELANQYSTNLQFMNKYSELMNQISQSTLSATDATKQLNEYIGTSGYMPSLTSLDSYKSPYTDDEMKSMLKGIDIEKLLKSVNIGPEQRAIIQEEFRKLASITAELTEAENGTGFYISEDATRLNDLYAAQLENIIGLINKFGSEVQEKNRIYNDLYEDLRNHTLTPVGFDEGDKSEFGDDWSHVFAKYGRGYGFLKKGEPRIDGIWTELASLYPGLFDSSIDQVNDQLKEFIGLLEKVTAEAKNKSERVYVSLGEEQLRDIQDALVTETSKVTNNIEAQITKENELAAAAEKAADAEKKKEEASAGMVRQLEQQANAASDVGEEAEDSIKEALSILPRDVERALEQLRGALGDKKNLIDLSGVFSEKDLEYQISELIKKVNQSDLKFDSIDLFGDTAAIQLSNKELGLHITELYQLKKATEDAAEANLQFIETSRVRVSGKEQESYIAAQQKAVDKTYNWLTAQQKKLNTQIRNYQYSQKKINGSTSLLDIDATTLEKDADSTIDGLVAHIQKRIQENLGKKISEGTKNQILQDLNALENEIKIQQLQKYTSTTMSASEVEAARKSIVNMLDTIASKARKNNVFDQISESYDSLRRRLTDNTVEGYIKDNFTDAINEVRVIKSDLGIAIANAGELKNLLGIQEKLYEAKKKYAEFEANGELDSSEGLKATRKLEEIQQQYDASVKLLKNEEQRTIVKEREIKLEQELNTFKNEQATRQEDIDSKNVIAEQEKQIKQYYQTILDTVNKINSLDVEITGLKSKNGTGIYTNLINQLQQDKNKLIASIRATLQEVNQEFGNGVLGQEAVSLSGARFFSEEDIQNLNAFMQSAQVQSALAAGDINKFKECVDQLSVAFTNSEKIGIEAATKIRESFAKAQEAASKIFTIDPVAGVVSSKGNINENTNLYQQAKNAYDMLKLARAQIGNKPETDWTAQESLGIEMLVKQFLEYANTLDTVTQKEQKYFAGKNKLEDGQGPNSLIVRAQETTNGLKEIQDAMTKAAQEFAGDNGAIITKFIQSADGINRLNFSVFDRGTGALRNFSLEMGNATDGMYITETTVRNTISAFESASKQMQATGEMMRTLKEAGIEGSIGYEKLNEVMSKLTAELSKGSGASDSKLVQLAKDAKLSTAEVEKLYKQYKQMQDAFESRKAKNLGVLNTDGSTADVYDKLSEKVREFAKRQQDATLEIGNFNAKTNTLTYTLTSADGTVTTYALHMDQLSKICSNQIISVKELGSKWDQFKASLSSVGKQFMTAMVGANVFYKALSQLRKGYQYVKEIDLAMTELKKVTDETEASYDRFLKTASKTAATIGSTVSDFTEATANFARLGYSMDEASKMAETAIVYKNVADGLDTVEESTESIISTMKAFGIESDNTISIIDKFNEVKSFLPPYMATYTEKDGYIGKTLEIGNSEERFNGIKFKIMSGDKMDNIYLNNLMDQYPDKTILEINDILLKNGVNNKYIKIKVPCRVCGREVIIAPGTYKKQKVLHVKSILTIIRAGKIPLFITGLKQIVVIVEKRLN